MGTTAGTNGTNGGGNGKRPKTPPDVKELDRALTKLRAKDPLSWTSRLGDVGKAIEEWRESMIDDLGGEEHVTAMQRVVVDLAAKTLIMLDVVDQYILNPNDQKILNLERSQMYLIVLQRKALADSLERYMRDLGFQRKRAPKTVNRIIQELLESSDLNRDTLMEAHAEIGIEGSEGAEAEADGANKVVIEVGSDDEPRAPRELKEAREEIIEDEEVIEVESTRDDDDDENV